jgi:phosphate:Na+ symporter
MDYLSLIYQILKILGALGLFLYGMKLMSEALQKVAGGKIRNFITTFTSTRIKSIFSGLVITSVIQSSSATTVMLVSFVNAGLVTLTESIGLMMGANIGTTIKIWLITLLGIKFSISMLLLPLIGISFPLIFSKSGKRKSWGEFIMGFSLLFLGIDFLLVIFPNIGTNLVFIEYLKQFTGHGIWSVLIFIAIGLIFTSIVQSSSAMITMTIVMAANGIITFENAVAMVLGENIGTTITANMAALVANKTAKRTALSHTFFNIFGVIWALVVFYPYLNFIDYLVNYFWNKSPFIDNTAIPIALCFFHTSFNLINTLLLFGFIPQISKLLSIIIKDNKKKDKHKVKDINFGILSTSEMSLRIAQKEVYSFGVTVSRMFDLVPLLLTEKDEKKYEKIIDKINKIEVICDKKEKEISSFIVSLTQNDLSLNGSLQISAMLKMIDNIESIGDACYQMSKIIENKNQQKIWFTQNMRDDLNLIFQQAKQSLDNMVSNLEINFNEVSSIRAYEIENTINKLRDEILSKYNYGNSENKFSVQTLGIFFSLVSYSEKIGDYALNITEAIKSTKS